MFLLFVITIVACFSVIHAQQPSILFDGLPFFDVYTFPNGSVVSVVALANDSVLIGDFSINTINAYSGNGQVTPTTSPSVTLSGFNHPHGVWAGIDSSTFLVADTLNFVVRQVNPSSNYSVSVYAGQEGVEGYSGDNGTATAATLWSPFAGTTSGNYTYIADLHSCMIRAVDSSGIITKFFGEHRVCQSDATHLNHPSGVGNYNGILFVAEMWGNRITQISLSNPSSVTYLIGDTGNSGITADGSVTAASQIHHPTCLFVVNNDVFFCEKNQIRDIYNNDMFTDFTLEHPRGLFADGSGGYYVADPNQKQVFYAALM